MTTGDPAMRLVRWHTDDLLRRLDDVIAVYGAAMGYPGGLLETRRGYVAAQAGGRYWTRTSDLYDVNVAL